MYLVLPFVPGFFLWFCVCPFEHWEVLLHLVGLQVFDASLMLSFPCSSAGKESACQAGGLGSIPGLGRSPEEGKGYPLQYSGLENFMDCIVHGVTKSQTGLGGFHFCHLNIFNLCNPFLCNIAHFSVFSSPSLIATLVSHTQIKYTLQM